MIVVVPTNAAEASTSVSKTVEGKREEEEEEEAGGREVWCRSGDGGEILSRTRSCDAYAASTNNFANLRRLLCCRSFHSSSTSCLRGAFSLARAAEAQ